MHAVTVTSDTKSIIGTIVGTGLVVSTLFVAVISAQFSAVQRRFDDMRDRMDRIETDYRSLDARRRAVEISFGKVDQRPLTIEPALVPARPDP